MENSVKSRHFRLKAEIVHFSGKNMHFGGECVQFGKTIVHFQCRKCLAESFVCEEKYEVL